jgi:hypothetical protein
LSACANKAADRLDLSLRDRAAVNQHNIGSILGLPNTKAYNHVADGRRRREVEGDDISAHESGSSSSSSDDDYHEPHNTPSRPGRAAKRPRRATRERRVDEDDSENSSDRDFVVDNDVVEYEHKQSKHKKTRAAICISSSSSTESVE